jgi:head-tail adaptor
VHTLTLERPANTVDLAGHVNLADDQEWISEGNIRVRFVTKGGSERAVFGQVEATVSHVMETPSTHRSRQIKPYWRLRDGSRKFNIVAVYDVDEERKVVRIEVIEER